MTERTLLRVSACPPVSVRPFACLCGKIGRHNRCGDAAAVTQHGCTRHMMKASWTRSEGAATELRLDAVLVDPTVTVVVLCQRNVHMRACAQPYARNHVCASLEPTDRQDERSMGGASPALMHMWGVSPVPMQMQHG
jgi:hypothetical protein